MPRAPHRIFFHPLACLIYILAGQTAVFGAPPPLPPGKLTLDTLETGAVSPAVRASPSSPNNFSPELVHITPAPPSAVPSSLSDSVQPGDVPVASPALAVPLPHFSAAHVTTSASPGQLLTQATNMTASLHISNVTLEAGIFSAGAQASTAISTPPSLSGGSTPASSADSFLCPPPKMTYAAKQRRNRARQQASRAQASSLPLPQPAAPPQLQQPSPSSCPHATGSRGGCCAACLRRCSSSPPPAASPEQRALLQTESSNLYGQFSAAAVRQQRLIRAQEGNSRPPPVNDPAAAAAPSVAAQRSDACGANAVFRLEGAASGCSSSRSSPRGHRRYRSSRRRPSVVPAPPAPADAVTAPSCSSPSPTPAAPPEQRALLQTESSNLYGQFSAAAVRQQRLIRAQEGNSRPPSVNDPAAAAAPSVAAQRSDACGANAVFRPEGAATALVPPPTQLHLQRGPPSEQQYLDRLYAHFYAAAGDDGHTYHGGADDDDADYGIAADDDDGEGFLDLDDYFGGSDGGGDGD